MRLSRIASALVLVAAGSAGAWAAKLDKSACTDLNAELAGVVAAGARGDMERGPDWAQTNLAPDKLANIRRLIELEEQLEFRCGIGRSRIVSKSPAGNAPAGNPPAKRSDDKLVVPDGPAMRSPPAGKAAKPALMPAVSPKPSPLSTAAKPVLTPAVSPKPSQPSTAAKPVLTPTVSLKPTQPGTAATPAVSPKPSADVKKAAAPTATLVAAPSASPAAAAPMPPAATRAKPSRRETSSAYVSPAEVNPFFMGFGNSQ